ncbi:general substrate transporter [Lipomyces oligophaga]|uniref:general substrate transporter n=1 Tax=Lipomyces oligophaga TaxID=45792 RepID=UPI0034CD3962
MFARDRYYGLRGKHLNVYLAFVAGLGFFLFGYDQGVTGGLLTLETFITTFPEMDTTSDSLSESTQSHNSTIQGTVVALYEIGCMFGALTCIYLGDKIGRRKTIFYGAAVMTVGAVIQASSFSVAQLIVGRIVTGYGNGYITATVPTWQAECARPEMRGPLVIISSFLVTAGIAFSYWIDLGFYFVESEANWRFPMAFQILFTLILMATVLDLPESPRWLIKQDRLSDAASVFIDLAGLGEQDVNNPIVQAQIAEIRATLTEESKHKNWDVFNNKNDRNLHRALLGIGIQFLQQIAGINVVIYYASYIYEHSIGLSPLNSKILAAVAGTEYSLVTLTGYWTIERIGRRAPYYWCSIFMSIVLGAIAAAVYYADKSNTQAGIAAAVLVFVYLTIFAIGWANGPWLYPAEITPLGIRAAANGLSTASNWITNFMVVMITPIAMNSIGAYSYVIWAACNLFINAPITYIFYPETKGRSLEEIDKIFEKCERNKPWQVVQIARDLPRGHLDILELNPVDITLAEKNEVEQVENIEKEN